MEIRTARATNTRRFGLILARNMCEPIQCATRIYDHGEDKKSEKEQRAQLASFAGKHFSGQANLTEQCGPLYTWDEHFFDDWHRRAKKWNLSKMVKLKL